MRETENGVPSPEPVEACSETQLGEWWAAPLPLLTPHPQWLRTPQPKLVCAASCVVSQGGALRLQGLSF